MDLRLVNFMNHKKKEIHGHLFNIPTLYFKYEKQVTNLFFVDPYPILVATNAIGEVL